MPLPETGFLGRHHVAIILAVSMLSVVPFALFHWSVGNALVFSVALGLILLMVGVTIWVFVTDTLALPCLFIAVGSASAVLIVTATIGIHGAFWAFPLVLVNYLLFALRPALIANALFLLAMLPVALVFLPMDMAIRALITLLLVSVFTFVFSYAVHRGFASVDRLTQIDPLTGVWNRRHLHMRLPEPENWLQRDGVPSSVIVLDIDHFKNINDQHGHATGDDILVRIGTLLNQRTRDRDLVFRYGGEEFVLILPNTREKAAERLAIDLGRRVAEIRRVNGQRITMSAGVAELQTGETPEAWLARADAALLRAKEAGRNRVHCASDPESGRPLASLEPISSDVPAASTG